jgi:hypothetical protein
MGGEIAVKNTLGSLDNLADLPNPETWTAKEMKTYAPKLALCVSLYYVYRVIHHYYYDKDENDQRDLFEAAKAAGWDLALKATMELFLQDYLKKAEQSDSVFGVDAKKAKEFADKDDKAFGDMRDKAFAYAQNNLGKDLTKK